MLARQILDDGHQLGVGPLRAASDHLIDGLQPLIAGPARRRSTLRLVTRAAQTLEVGFGGIGGRLLRENRGRRYRGADENKTERKC